MRFISHRGAGGLATENSRRAITLGDSFKPELIEVDLHQTSDSVAVVFHGKIHRGYRGTPLSQTYEQLKSDHPELLTLEELFALKTDAAFLLDIKCSDAASQFIKMIKAKRDSRFETAFTGTNAKALMSFSYAFPGARIFLGQPYQKDPFGTIRQARILGFEGISLNKWWLGPLVHLLCRRSNLEIYCYSVKRPLTMRVIKRYFPEVTVITDFPDRASKLD